MLSIHIQDFPVSMRLGVYPEERQHPQEVLISMRLDLNPSIQPGRSDDLQQTVDYGAVMGCVREILEHREVKLVETVVDYTGNTVLEQFSGVERVHVSVVKSTLPPRIARTAVVRVEQTFSRLQEART